MRAGHVLPALAAFGTVALVVLAANVGPSVAGRLMHPRDVDAYQAYVGGLADTDTIGTVSAEFAEDRERDAAWVAAHPDLLLAAGDRACDWLKTQPKAPKVDPAGNSDVSTLERDYLGVDFGSVDPPAYDDPGRDGVGLPISPDARYTVVAGAWEYLCWSTRESRTAPVSLEDD